jgi:carbon monoxide dehydrogenase subunit G
VIVGMNTSLARELWFLECSLRTPLKRSATAAKLFSAGPRGLKAHGYGFTKEIVPMAMVMTGEVQLAASREVVYAKLNDAEVLKACIPGCEELIKSSDTEMTAVAVTKIGPVKARFKGKVHLTDLDPPNGYRISGEGDGGVAGFAKGGASVALTEKDGGTLLTYNVEAQIGGKLAQLGQRLVNGAAKKIADDFFKNFAAMVSPPPA